MAQIQYTPYIKKTETQFKPMSFTEFNTPVTKNISKSKEEISIAPVSEIEAIEPVPEVTSTIVKGIISNPKKYNVGNMQPFLDALANAGISFRITSGIRPGAMTKSGHRSHHADGNAVDIVIDGGKWEDAKRKIKADKQLQALFKSKGIGILDETTPDVMSKTGATGAHWHIGPDRWARQMFETIIAKRGTKLQPKRNIAYTPYVNLDPALNRLYETDITFYNPPEKQPIVLADYKPRGYQIQYNLAHDVPVVELPEVTVTPEKTIADLAKFTGSFETFRPDAYVLNTSEGKPQTLAGYGSANPKIIELAKQGKLTEEIARKEMERKLQAEYDEWMNRVENFKNLPRNVQLALVDTSYNGKGVVGTIKGSPNLMNMINSGITDPRELVKHMTHSKSANGWLGVRSAARRAMALGEYDWNWPLLDKYGRQVDYSQYKGPQDWKSSPYYNKY